MTKYVTKCGWCGERLTQPRRGRRRSYCTASCRQRAYETRRMERATANADRANGEDRDAFRRAVVDVLLEFGLLPPSASR